MLESEPRSRSSWLTGSERAGFIDFWHAYDAIHDELRREMERTSAADPALRHVLTTAVGTALEELTAVARTAVEDVGWSHVETKNRELAARAAGSGLGFDAWLGLTQVLTDVVGPRLVESLAADPPRLAAAVRAMGSLRNQLLALFVSELVEAKERPLRELRALAVRLQHGIEDERQHIAREMHDQLGQQLTALKLNLAWVLRRGDERHGPAVTERLRAMIELVDETVQTVGQMTTRLRPGILDDLGLVATLEWQAHELETRSGLTLDVTLPEDDLQLPSEHATTIFRTFQEIMTNVVRHAAAQKVRIRLERGDAELVLEVEDDGRGITPTEAASGTSLGLIGMRERVAILGGSIAIEGAQGRGTRVRVGLPLAPAGAP